MKPAISNTLRVIKTFEKYRYIKQSWHWWLWIYRLYSAAGGWYFLSFLWKL